uniref:Uncharacterized protein n=1 Tax=Anguilla anguilla TaxID=7936 RepID=A0A0E9U176_ANGAN
MRIPIIPLYLRNGKMLNPLYNNSTFVYIFGS